MLFVCLFVFNLMRWVFLRIMWPAVFTCYGLNACVDLPTDSYAEILTPRVTVLRQGDLWKVSGRACGALVNGMSARIQRRAGFICLLSVT